MEEELVQKKTERFSEEVNLHEFAQILRIDAKESATQQLFRIHDRVCIMYYFLFITIIHCNDTCFVKYLLSFIIFIFSDSNIKDNNN